MAAAILVVFGLVDRSLIDGIPDPVDDLNVLKGAGGDFTPQLTLIPQHPVSSNYLVGWVKSGFGNYFMNTLIIAAGAVFFSVVFNSMAGFALAKYRFFGRDGIFLFILAALMVPFR